jgi:aspartate aminotransferase
MFEEGIALKKQYGAENVFDFSLGNPDVPPPPVFYRTLRECVADGAAGVHGYMPNAGFLETREAVARKVSRDHNVHITGSEVVMAVGAAGALNAVLKSILNPGDEVIVSKPFFMEYRQYAANHQGRLVEVASQPDFNLDLNAIQNALSAKTAAVLINSPNNPTGRVYPAETLAGLSELLLEHGVQSGRFPYLITDEPYRELVYDGRSTPPVMLVYPHTIVVYSFSKSLSLPGERIGYAAVAPAIDDKENLVAGIIYTTRVLGYVNAPALMQRCVTALAGEKLEAGVYAGRRAAFIEVLNEAGIGFAPPEGAFYIFAKVPAKVGGTGDDAAFSAHLKKHLILSVPGSAFGAPGWIRLAYCVNEKIIRASAPSFKKAAAEYQ